MRNIKKSKQFAALLAAAAVALSPVPAYAGPSEQTGTAAGTQGPGGSSAGTAAGSGVVVVSGGSGSGSAGTSQQTSSGAQQSVSGGETPEKAYVVNRSQVSYPGGVSAVTTPLMTGNAEAKALGAIAKGVDLSRWNGVTDWSAVKNAGVSFAILATRSRTAEDATFRPVAEGAAKQGIRLGAYI